MDMEQDFTPHRPVWLVLFDAWLWVRRSVLIGFYRLWLGVDVNQFPPEVMRYVYLSCAGAPAVAVYVMRDYLELCRFFRLDWESTPFMESYQRLQHYPRDRKARALFERLARVRNVRRVLYQVLQEQGTLPWETVSKLNNAQKSYLDDWLIYHRTRLNPAVVVRITSAVA
jgi:hypothetical protein